MLLCKVKLLSLRIRINRIKLQQCQQTLTRSINDGWLKLNIEQMDTRYEILVYMRLIYQRSIISRKLRINIDAFVRTRVLLHYRGDFLQKIVNDVQEKLKAPVLLVFKHVVNNLICSQGDLKVENVFNRQGL